MSNENDFEICTYKGLQLIYHGNSRIIRLDADWISKSKTVNNLTPIDTGKCDIE